MKMAVDARILREEALKRDIILTPLDEEAWMMEKDGYVWYTRGSRTSLQSSVGKTLADYKDLSKAIMTKFEIPTAKYVVAKSLADVEECSNLTFPLVAKPSFGNKGTNVVIGIATMEEARAYFQNTPKNYINGDYESILYEEMLQGDEFRITCVDYTVVAGSYRKPAYVMGDGTHTIEELITEKNQHPWRDPEKNFLGRIEIDKELHICLAEQKVALDECVPAGKEVYLRKTSNVSRGGEPANITESICQENRELFEKIARAFHLNTIGIDVMCQDLSVPLSEQPHAGIVEVNAAPGLRVHHYPTIGEPINVAKKIIDMAWKYKDRFPTII